MISVDDTGIIFEWIYNADFFSGFGWFTPRRRFEFDLHTAPEGRVGSVALRKAYLCANAGELHIVTERQVRACVREHPSRVGCVRTALLQPQLITCR